MNRIKSPLVVYTRLSPNCTKPRKGQVRRLTPHCVAGNLTLEAILGLSRFVNSDPINGASCNYAIGTDGRLGLGVEEIHRSWCSSSPTNDMEALTCEIANDGGSPDWHMSDAAINKWLDLAVDAAKAHGFKKVAYQSKPTNVSFAQSEQWIKSWAPADAMIITLHCWYSNKACPGPYFIRQLPWLVREINKRLSGTAPEAFVGEGASPPKVVAPPEKETVTTPVETAPLKESFKAYAIKINVPALNVRKGPGTNTPVVKTLTNDKNLYTIVAEAEGPGATKWLKFKSGIGWVAQDFITKM